MFVDGRDVDGSLRDQMSLPGIIASTLEIAPFNVDYVKGHFLDLIISLFI